MKQRDEWAAARSIPACTGEPTMRRMWGHMSRVYPRVYGGTSAPPGYNWQGVGLSPRVRGNRNGSNTD